MCRKWYGAYLNPVAWTVYGLCTTQLGDVTGQPVALDNGGIVRPLMPTLIVLGLHHSWRTSVHSFQKHKSCTKQCVQCRKAIECLECDKNACLQPAYYGGAQTTVSQYLEDRFGFYYGMRGWCAFILVGFIAVFRIASIAAVRILVFQKR